MNGEATKTKGVNLRLPPADYAKLRDRAKEAHRSIPAEIRLAIERHLKAAA